MKRFAVVLATLVGAVGCAGRGSPVAAGPTLTDSSPVAATSTACYQGLSSGAGQRVRTIVRRTVNPGARRILEEVAHDDPGGIKTFHAVTVIDGNRFTMTEAGGAFTGTGTLTGAPWQWTSWTSTSTSRLGDARIEVESHDELTRTGRIAHKQVRKDGAVVATIVEDLTAFDCAGWDQARAQLAVPVLDDALCDRACRRYATLKFWAANDAQIAALPADARDDARRTKAAELAAKLDAGSPGCIAQCRSASNATQTACLAQAASIEQLGACDAR